MTYSTWCESFLSSSSPFYHHKVGETKDGKSILIKLDRISIVQLCTKQNIKFEHACNILAKQKLLKLRKDSLKPTPINKFTLNQWGWTYYGYETNDERETRTLRRVLKNKNCKLESTDSVLKVSSLDSMPLPLEVVRVIYNLSPCGVWDKSRTYH
jgi:hypothetical protein